MFAPAFVVSPLAASVLPAKVAQSRQLAGLLTGTASAYFELVNKLKRQALQPSIAAATPAPRTAARKLAAELDAKTAFAACFPLPTDALGSRRTTSAERLAAATAAAAVALPVDAPTVRTLRPSPQLDAATAFAAAVPLPVDAPVVREVTRSPKLNAATTFAAAVPLPADAPVVRKSTRSPKLDAATAFAAAVPLPADAPVVRELTRSPKLDAATAFAAAVPLPAEANKKVRFADPLLIPPSIPCFRSPPSVKSPDTAAPTQFFPEVNARRAAPSYLEALRAAALRFFGALAGALVGAWATTTAAAGRLSADVGGAIGAVVTSVAVLFAQAQNAVTRTFGAGRSGGKEPK